jgi:hypothetical protein
VTPLNPNTTKRYSTRRNAQGTLCFVPEPELVYHRRRHRLQAREENNSIGFETLYDIRILFVDSSPLTQMASSW